MAERILVVDDEESGLFFLSEMLRAEGFEVHTAVRAEDAIRTGLDKRPRFLITDWMLRDTKDGIDVAKELRAAIPRLGVLLVTGMSAGDCRDELAELLPSLEVIEKPVTLEKIIDALSRLSVP